MQISQPQCSEIVNGVHDLQKKSNASELNMQSRPEELAMHTSMDNYAAYVAAAWDLELYLHPTSINVYLYSLSYKGSYYMYYTQRVN